MKQFYLSKLQTAMSLAKKVSLIVALAFGISLTSSAAVIETVGASDLSSGWWSAFSTVKALTGNGTIHYTFVNHNKGAVDGVNTWNNWSLVISNGKASGEDGYAENVVLRADNYGWGTVYDNGFWANNFVWDTFIADMNGATVDIDITRNDNFLQVYTTVTTTANKTYYSNFKTESSALTSTIGTFLTVDGAYLEISETSTNANTDEFVGAPDYSTAWWTAFSKYVTLTGNGTIHYEFYNYNTGTGSNWNNFLIGVTNDDVRNGSNGYSEYLILRADNYGWANLYAAGTWGTTPDWDTFVADLNGAFVSLDITRTDAAISVTGTITSTANKVLNYSFSTTGITTESIRTFLTAELASLKITKTEVKSAVTGVSTVEIENSNTPIEYYNLQGIRVNSENLSNGIYIRRQGNKAEKVFIR
jgi:hypothetical protein